MTFKEVAELEGHNDDVEKLTHELEELEERAKELDKKRTSNISAIR